MTSNHIGTARVFVGGQQIGTAGDVTVTVGEVRPYAVMTHARQEIEGSIELTVTMTAREYWAGRLFLIGGCRLPRGMQK